MANTQGASVIRVDTSAAFVNAKFIQSIKYIGAASGTATIKDGSSTGNTLYEESGANNVYNADVCIKAGQGVYVTVTNSAVVYIYLK